jgi:hypothetical protein
MFVPPAKMAQSADDFNGPIHRGLDIDYPALSGRLREGMDGSRRPFRLNTSIKGVNGA